MMEINWKLVALAAMACFADHEGVIFEEEWTEWGMPEEWRETILRELRTFQEKQRAAEWEA